MPAERRRTVPRLRGCARIGANVKPGPSTVYSIGDRTGSGRRRTAGPARRCPVPGRCAGTSPPRPAAPGTAGPAGSRSRRRTAGGPAGSGPRPAGRPAVATPCPLEVCSRADPGQHQQVRRGQRAGGDDDLGFGPDPPYGAAGGVLHPDGRRAVEQHPGRPGPGGTVRLGCAEHRMQVPDGGARAAGCPWSGWTGRRTGRSPVGRRCSRTRAAVSEFDGRLRRTPATRRRPVRSARPTAARRRRGSSSAPSAKSSQRRKYGRTSS